MLLNVGGAGLVALGIVLVVRTELTPKPETPICEARYQGGVLFSYRRKENVPLSAEDLQARLAGTDRGLLSRCGSSRMTAYRKATQWKFD